jgi:hypothetical protein
MSKEELKQLIQAVYDDFDFVDFNLHFVDEVESHKVYEIKNNRINNKLKDTTLVAVNSMVTNKEIEILLLYGVDVQAHIMREMIYESAKKILFDVYDVTIDWVRPIEVEMTITNWELKEEKTETGIIYNLRFEVA